MSNPAKNCRWVLANGDYCERPVHYKMVWDGGEIGSTKVREYEAFCPEHKARAVSTAFTSPEDEEDI